MPEIVRIGLVVDAVASYGRGIIRGIMNYARSNPSWRITVEPQWSFDTPSDIEQWEVDGLIVQTFSQAFIEKVAKTGLPATNVSNFVEGETTMPTVLPDDQAVGLMAAEYLLAQGFRELGYVWPGDVPYGKIRLDAFRDRAAQNSVPVHVCIAKKQDLGEWVAGLPKPIGVLGCNDDWAHRLLNAARHRGVRLPDEVAVLGVDNDELFNSLVTPSLSSIATPVEQIGHEAASQLNRLIHGEKLPVGPTLLPPLRVVPRESTDVLTVNDEDVVLAVRYIRDHAGQQLQVDDVLDHVPLTRRSLERRFRKLLGHSISDEIRRAHIERAKQFLVNTDMSMAQLAAACGFSSASRLGIVFGQLVGEPPTEYRARARAGGRR